MSLTPPSFMRAFLRPHAISPAITGACCLSPLLALAAPQVFVVTDGAGQPVRAAALSVFVHGAPAAAPPGTLAVMGQRNKSFDPSILVIQTGTQVSFPNFDTVRHHVYSFSPTRPFEIKLYSGTPAQPVLFDKPGTATLGCNIHDRMLAFIHVVDTAHFGLSNPEGHVTLDLPVGEHLARVWTPAMGEKSAGQAWRFSTGRGTVTLKLVPP